MEQPKTRTSGFASMDQTKQREIARKGGVAAHRKGTAHEFTSDEARDAGRKGGNSVSTNRAHMTEIGRRGGQRSAERRRKNRLEGHPGDTTGSSASARSGGETAVNFIETPTDTATVIPPTQDVSGSAIEHPSI